MAYLAPALTSELPEIKHSWILKTTNSCLYSSTILFHSLAQDFPPFFHIPPARYFQLMPFVEAVMDGRSIFPSLVPSRFLGVLGRLLDATRELKDF